MGSIYVDCSEWGCYNGTNISPKMNMDIYTGVRRMEQHEAVRKLWKYHG